MPSTVLIGVVSKLIVQSLTLTLPALQCSFSGSSGGSTLDAYLTTLFCNSFWFLNFLGGRGQVRGKEATDKHMDGHWTDFYQEILF